MKSPLIRLGGMAAMASLFSSCASIVSGTAQSISFSSSPSGANIIVDSAPRGTTPTQIRLSTHRSHEVTIEMRGYLPYNVSLDQCTNGWIFGNLLFGGLIGIVIDMADGAAYGLTPSQVNAVLTPEQLKRDHADNGRNVIYIGTVLKADPHWIRIGQLTKRERVAAN